MAKVKYIDPAFKEVLDAVSPAIKNEVRYSLDIAKRINDILILKHWSQADLARALNKPKPLVSRWLSGTHNFTIQTLAAIETALGYSIISVRKTPEFHPVRGYKHQSDRAQALNEAYSTRYGASSDK